MPSCYRIMWVNENNVQDKMFLTRFQSHEIQCYMVAFVWLLTILKYRSTSVKTIGSLEQKLVLAWLKNWLYKNYIKKSFIFSFIVQYEVTFLFRYRQQLVQEQAWVKTA